MTTTLTLIPPTVDKLRASDQAWAIAGRVIEVMERDDRLKGGEFTTANLEGLAEEIEKAMREL
jgi:hypothetical protein